MSDADANAKATNPTMTITVTDNQNNVVFFKVNEKTTLLHLWNAYCQREGISVLFIHNDDLIRREDYDKTLINLGMTNLGIAEIK
jgi:hypothetical protein